MSNNYEALLKQTQESLEFALQSGRMGAWDINLETNKVSCSHEMLQLWGVSPLEFQEQRSILQDKVHPEDLEKMNAAIDSAIRDQSTYELEYRIIPRPNELRWVLSRGRCTYNESSKLPARFSGVVFDITDRILKEETLASAVKARDQFFMAASHELRTPLTCLLLQLQVTEWKIKHELANVLTNSRLEINFDKQRDQIQRITRILDNIAEFSNLSEGSRLNLKLNHFDLSELVTDVLEQIKRETPSTKLEVKYKLTERVAGKWDRFQMEQVLLNLLTNAIRYGNQKPIEVEVGREGSNALLIVRDQGIGLNSEEQSQLFDYSASMLARNEMSGIGLGLFISKNIIEAHGGEIKVKSEPGKGSEFAVIIPIST